MINCINLGELWGEALRRLADKLRSSKGVSMPLALLLFLVCATLASIVLAAATTSVGTATTLKESESSYYSVTSAAKLFRDELNGQTIVIDQTKDGDTIVTKVDETAIDAGGSNVKNLTLLEQATYQLMGSGSSWGKEFGKVSSPLSLGEIALTANQCNPAIAATVKPTANVDGDDVRITFKFTQNAAKDNSKVNHNGYQLELGLSADCNSYDDVDERGKEKRVTTVTWYADELRVVGGTS